MKEERSTVIETVTGVNAAVSRFRVPLLLAKNLGREEEKTCGGCLLTNEAI